MATGWCAKILGLTIAVYSERAIAAGVLSAFARLLLTQIGMRFRRDRRHTNLRHRLKVILCRLLDIFLLGAGWGRRIANGEPGAGQAR
jgi:hypothetical protein